jgi:hypothetical protein
MMLICLAQSSFAEKTQVGLINNSINTFSSCGSLNVFSSVRTRHLNHQAINIGWGKRGKKIIQMRLAAGICREDFLSFPIITVDNPIPKDPNYTLLRFSCLSYRGPPAINVLF